MVLHLFEASENGTLNHLLSALLDTFGVLAANPCDGIVADTSEPAARVP